MSRVVKTIVTEKKYTFLCPLTKKEESLVLFESLTEDTVKAMEAKLGGKVYYNLESVTKACYSLPIEKFTAAKGVTREEIKTV